VSGGRAPCLNVDVLHVEYAERGNEYGILFIFSLFCEYMHLEYVRIHVIYRVDQAEHGIHVLVIAPQEYVNIYSTRRVDVRVNHRVASLAVVAGGYRVTPSAMHLGLYTILLLPMLQDAWHTKGRSREGRVLPNSRAIQVQQCGQYRLAGRLKERMIRAETTRSKRISCKGQYTSSR